MPKTDDVLKNLLNTPPKSKKTDKTIKIQAIKDYLLQLFPDDNHNDMEDFDRFGQKFRIITKENVLLLSVSNELIEDNNINDIIAKLKNYKLTDLFKQHPKSTIVARSNRVTIEPRN